MRAAGHAGAKAPRVRVGDKDLLDREIMTAGPHQPTDLPGVLQDGRLRGGDEDHPDFGRTGGGQARLVPFQHVTASKQPGAMLAAARIRPAPTDAIPACHDRGAACGSHRAGQDHTGITPKQVFRGLRGQIGPHEAVAPPDERTPAGRPVEARHRFHDPVEGQRWHL